MTSTHQRPIHRLTLNSVNQQNQIQTYRHPIYRLTLLNPVNQQNQRREDTPTISTNTVINTENNISQIVNNENNILPKHIQTSLLINTELTCIVCLNDLNNENVAITKCGHNYCKDCLGITLSLDKQRQKCGECRTEFR